MRTQPTSPANKREGHRRPATSRATLAAYREELLARLGNHSAATITEGIQEPAFRAAFGCEQVEGRTPGFIDAWPTPGKRTAGRGYECKTLLISDRATRARLWPNAMPHSEIVVPSSRSGWLNDTDPILVEFEHARIAGSIKMLYRMIESDPADAGRWLMSQLRDRYVRAVAAHRVRSASYALLLRDPSGKHVAHAEREVTLPLRSADSLVWDWQRVPDEDAEDDTQPDGEPICLQAFEPSGVLVARWYLRGGQVLERVALDSATVVRMTMCDPDAPALPKLTAVS